MRMISLLCLALLLSMLILGCNQNSEEQKAEVLSLSTANAPTPVEGAWQLVWAEYDNKLADTSNHFLFKDFNNGVFSLIAYDSTKKINFAGYGKYGFEGDTYHETFIYHNNPEYVGGADWQDLVVKGDTMYMNGFKKIIVGGKDVTSGWTKVREKLVRVKWN